MKTIRDMPPEKFWRSPDVQGFVEKFRANPDDDLARLVFCDWLEDTACGEIDAAHADYIRTAIQWPRSTFEVPGKIKARVFAGFGSHDRVNDSAFLARSSQPSRVGTGFIASIERGLLSRVHVVTDNGVTLPQMVDELAGPSMVWRWMWDGPLASNVAHGKNLKPIAMWHPYYVVLADREQLHLDTFCGMKTNDGQTVEAEYLGQKFPFDVGELVRRRDTAGDHVVTETITRYWAAQFKWRLDFPVQVRLAPGLLKEINQRLRQVNPL